MIKNKNNNNTALVCELRFFPILNFCPMKYEVRTLIFGVLPVHISSQFVSETCVTHRETALASHTWEMLQPVCGLSLEDGTYHGVILANTSIVPVLLVKMGSCHVVRKEFQRARTWEEFKQSGKTYCYYG